MELNSFRWQSSNLRGIRAIDRLELRSCPDLAGVGSQIHRAVQRLHHQMREVGNFVNCFDLFRRVGQRGGSVSVVSHACSRRLNPLAKVLHHLAGIEALHAAFVPLDTKGIAPGFGLPESVGNYRNARGNGNHLPHSGYRTRARIVKALHLCPEDRRPGDDSRQHPRQLHVDAEFSLAVQLLRCVEPLDRPANQFESLRILQLDVLRRRQLRCGGREMTVRKLATRAVQNRSRIRAAGGSVDVPLLRRGGD